MAIIATAYECNNTKKAIAKTVTANLVAGQRIVIVPKGSESATVVIYDGS